MNFMDAVKRKKRETGEALPVDIPSTVSEYQPTAELTDADIPHGMPLTHSLEKMTFEQGIWAIRNADAWLAYLKANGGELYQTIPVVDVKVSDKEKYEAICSVLEKVWLEMTENCQKSLLDPEDVPKWLEILKWADGVIPASYTSARKVIQSDFEFYAYLKASQKRKSKRKKRKKDAKMHN